MAPVDPQQLLKALNELLGPTGGVMGTQEAVRIANLMKDAKKIVSKCIYINILKVEMEKDIMEKLLSCGTWDTLNTWLQECKDEENYPLMVELLKVYRQLPVTVDLLKTNNAAKTIKQLCKIDHEEVKTRAKNIFDEWMKLVQPNNNNNDSKSKKKKEKEKDREREKDSERRSSKDSSKSSKDSSKSDTSKDRSDKDKLRSKDSKHRHESSGKDRDHKSHSGKDREKEKERNKIAEEENMDTSSNDSAQSEEREKATVRKGAGLKLHIKLGGDKGSNSDDAEKKRPSTVKRPPSKFRSTGLEEETVPSKLPKHADLSKTIPKRTGSDIKPELPNKRSRLHMPPPLTVPTVTTSTTVTTPTATSPTSPSPSEMHGKIKIIPARPKPKQVIKESTGFMDSLETSSRTYGAFKKKRRSSGATPPGNSNNKATPTPTTPPSPMSPTTAMARSLPSVPSFYQDTQESESTPEKDVKKERSPSPTEENNTEQGKDNSAKQENEQEETAEPETKERSVSPTESNSSKESKESKGLLTTGATKVKKKKKSVSWKDDHNLKQVFYFELDEDERVNVNRPKDFSQQKKDEMIFDRRTLESVRRMTHDVMAEQMTWYRPKVIVGYKVFEYGKDSKEIAIQKVREQGVLQALFFNKNMVPDNPQEPDFMSEEHEETKMIPLEDVSGGDQMLFNYDSHPKAVTGSGKPPAGPPELPPNAGLPPLPVGGPGGPGGPPPGMQGPPPQGFNLPPNLNLPPDLANILSQFQNTPANPGDPVMAQVQQILNNLMCGGSEQSFEQLQQIQHIMSAQMGIPPEALMNCLPPGMPPPMGMPPQGPMGMRAPLLGSAPPGFMPQRPMGPNRFGPPPGPQGNWGGNMGGPNMGPPQGGPNQGGNFGGGGGRMRGPWQGGGGGGGGNNRGNWGGGGGGGGGRPARKKCRHFSSGACRLGANCNFLHPGINGPPLENDEPVNS